MPTCDRSPDNCTLHPEAPAGAACEQCRRPFCERCLLQFRKQRLCGGCKHALLSRHFSVHQAPAPEAAGSAAPLGSDCSQHAGEAAAAICERCGDFMCYLCTTPYQGRYYCAPCFDLLWSRSAFQADRTAGDYRANLSAWFGLAGLLCMMAPFVNFLLGLSAFALAIPTLRSPEAPNRGLALAGAIMGALATIGGLAVTFYMLPTF